MLITLATKHSPTRTGVSQQASSSLINTLQKKNNRYGLQAECEYWFEIVQLV